MDMQHSASKYNVMQYNTKINQEKRRVLSDLQSVLSAGCEQYIDCFRIYTQPNMQCNVRIKDTMSD